MVQRRLDIMEIVHILELLGLSKCMYCYEGMIVFSVMSET